MKEQPNHIKDRIILSVFDYIETNQESHKLNAQEELSNFSKHYNVKIKKVARIDLKQAFRQFIDNRQGYKVTINKLYYSL